MNTMDRPVTRRGALTTAVALLAAQASVSALVECGRGVWSGLGLRPCTRLQGHIGRCA